MNTDNIGDGCFKCMSCLDCTEEVCVLDQDDSIELQLPKETYHKWNELQDSLLKDCMNLTDRQLAWIFDVSKNAIVCRRHKLGLSKEKKC